MKTKLAVVLVTLLAFGIVLLTGCPSPSGGGEYTVTFNADGGTPVPASQTVANGGKAAMPAAVIKAGFTFDGWYTAASGGAKWDFAVNTVTANLTLYARWIANPGEKYTVTFNADGGTPAPAPQQIDKNGLVTEPSAPIKDGFIFDGWYTEAEGSGVKWDFSVSTVNADRVLYAYWIEQIFLESVTLTYDGTANEGQIAVLEAIQALEAEGADAASISWEGDSSPYTGTLETKLNVTGIADALTDTLNTALGETYDVSEASFEAGVYSVTLTDTN